MAVVNGRSDDSAAFSQLLSAAEAVSADNIHSSPMTAVADHSNVGRGLSDASIATGGPVHENLHLSDAGSRGEQANGAHVATVSFSTSRLRHVVLNDSLSLATHLRNSCGHC
jgi:hypothetical protein